MKMPAFLMLFICSFWIQGYAQVSRTDSVSLSDTLTFDVEVYPNPSPTRRFSVAFNSPRVAKIHVQVFDAFQRVIFDKEINGTYGLSLHHLNLSDRPKGWYYLVITTENTKITKRLEGV